MISSVREGRGFALVMVLTLLGMLVLVVHAIAVAGRVGGQVATTAIGHTQARQHALLGLKLALARLQETAGALDAVTGTADILASTLPENGRWTGVWPAGGAAPEWLVSGVASPATFHAGVTFGVDRGDGPDVASQFSDNVVLVGNGSTNTAASRYLAGDAVLVPKVRISGAGNASAANPAGHFAYWVGDEGVKLSVQLPGINPPAAPAPATFAIAAIPYGWEPDHATVGRVVAYEQLVLAGAGPAALRSTFHRATLRHLGFVDAANRRAGLFNVNTAATRVWRGVAGTFDAGLTDARRQAFAGEIVAGFGDGPYRTPGAFASSPALARAVARLPAADVAGFLAAMGGWLAVRSDTFRIRAYGDAVNPADADRADAGAEAMAWCEAIVQRTEGDAAGGGGTFAVTHFRWLGPNDI